MIYFTLPTPLTLPSLPPSPIPYITGISRCDAMRYILLRLASFLKRRGDPEEPNDRSFGEVVFVSLVVLLQTYCEDGDCSSYKDAVGEQIKKKDEQ